MSMSTWILFLLTNIIIPWKEQPLLCTSFTFSPSYQSRTSFIYKNAALLKAAIVEEDEDDLASNKVNGLSKPKEMELELKEHKPLGCTAEESVAEDDDGTKAVFISKVTEGGFAGQAGIEVGDVIIGLSGVFDDVEDVSGAGLERVKALVNGRPSEVPLTIRVLRGTDTKSRHEEALLELCILPDTEEQDYLADCLNVIHEESFEPPTELKEAHCDENDPECMLDTLFEMWNDEIPDGTADSKEGGGKVKEEEVEKPARPWSSRSSPSGTYVRDPVTGEMKNIG